eukprot:Blabericola_migrator_1__2590@NODE_1730_length_3907_cov_230_321615_g1117_i0_p1_GENE_NODE_1730_length_3907_cov_230_321615_g1117_i0NODE_1730_length_3907_cov_230_321615_g1117_i0_p1_ORF_typecomplete_len248_score32_37_NODE_1730_length_3907_cov_230_321615_g1117_i027053448
MRLEWPLLSAVGWALRIHPHQFSKRIAVYTVDTDYILIANDEQFEDLVVTLTGNNTFWYNYHGDPEASAWVGSAADYNTLPAVLDQARSLRKKRIDAAATTDEDIDDEWGDSDLQGDSESTPTVKSDEQANSDGQDDSKRRQSIEELARQIKAGRAVGVLATLQDEGSVKSAAARPTDECGALCWMHQLGSECKSSVFASEHLRMFSITFEPAKCTLGDIIFVLSLLTSNPNVDFMEVDGVVDLHER